MNLKSVSKKLEELAMAYAEVNPKFTMAESAYLIKKANLMMSNQGFASQPLRDSAVEGEMALTKEYEEYMKLLPEIQIINTQIKIYSQISRNMVSIGWNEVDYGR